jgi:hypothetical protein
LTAGSVAVDCGTVVAGAEATVFIVLPLPFVSMLAGRLDELFDPHAFKVQIRTVSMPVDAFMKLL